jgi:hydrophobic/amphiphilic exporter-1 (mainly G- bacteria), HAE1 family
VSATYNAFFFVTLKPWSERTRSEEQYQAITSCLNRELAKVPGAVAFAFPPPSVPGIGTSGGFTFILEDRSGRQDLDFLTRNLNQFMEAARSRPELARISTTHLPDVPQVFVNVDRETVLRQGVALGDVYRTLLVVVQLYLALGGGW